MLLTNRYTLKHNNISQLVATTNFMHHVMEIWCALIHFVNKKVAELIQSNEIVVTEWKIIEICSKKPHEKCLKLWKIASSQIIILIKFHFFFIITNNEWKNKLDKIVSVESQAMSFIWMNVLGLRRHKRFIKNDFFDL